MVIGAQHKEKILAAHFAATYPSGSTEDFEAEDFEAFVIHRENKYDQLKLWWDDMDALRVIRAAEHYVRNHDSEKEQSIDPIKGLAADKNGFIQFKEKPIGKIYNYYRTVLPQEMQIRLAYDTLIERFIEFMQKNKYVIRLSENRLTMVLFIPDTDFQLEDIWKEFVQFAYSEEELYKTFTLFVNSMKLTNRGFGNVHFPSVTEDMKLWQTAFYIATLEERVVRYPDNYRKSKTDEDRKDAGTENRKELKQLLTELRNELLASTNGSEELDKLVKLFDKALRLSHRFNRTGATQFSYGIVKPRAKKGKIEDKIIDILSEQVRPLKCPLSLIDEIEPDSISSAGDTTGNRCYSCGRHLPPRTETRRFKGKLEANRFVFSDPSQRLQSGSGQAQPPICFDCLAVAFGCPIKFAEGAIIVCLSYPDEEDKLVSTEKYLQMLTLGELNLIAGQYLLIKCNDFVGSTPVSEKIGQVQYTLWRVAQTLPSNALEKPQISLFAGESEILLPRRHLVWLSYLNESFKPRMIVNGKDNIPLGQAIRLIQKDEVISAIYKLVTAESTKAKQLSDWSYSEKRSLEELREKHCDLLEKASNGDKLMNKQADFYRDVAALTGLTHAYCDSIRRLLVNNRKVSDKEVQIEVKKLIEDVANPTGFTYRATKEFADIKYSDTSAKVVRKDDNYFCYDQAKRLLKDVLEVDISKRKDDDNGQESLQVYYDDILNAYAQLSEEYDKAEWRKLATELKQNLYAKFPFLFRKETNQNGS